MTTAGGYGSYGARAAVVTMATTAYQKGQNLMATDPLSPALEQILDETRARAEEGCEGPSDQDCACYTAAPDNPVAWCNPCLHEQSHKAILAVRQALAEAHAEGRR